MSIIKRNKINIIKTKNQIINFEEVFYLFLMFIFYLIVFT